MGLMIKLFCALLVIGLAGMFVLKTPDGKPWLSIEQLLPDTSSLSEISKNLSALTKGDHSKDSDQTSSTTDNDSGIYRWKDANGQWQYSDKPQHEQAEQVDVSGNLNSDLVAKLKPRESVENNENTSTENTPSNSILPASLSPEKVSKLMEDTKNIQQLMDDRQSQLNQQIKQ